MSAEQFDTFRARFTPKRTDDLRPDALALVGQVFTWERLWVIEPGENDYAEHWACLIIDGPPRCDFAWVPECDLTVVDGGDRG